jgi:ribosomal protein S25
LSTDESPDDAATASSASRAADAGRPGLFSDERQEEILALIRQEKRVSVTSLADHFAVVGETIRRDLADLENRGLIRRVHGGAIPVERVTFEPPIEARHDLMRPEKERIALAALAELPGEGSAFIEAGSTTSFLARVLPADCSLTIVTNGGYIASSLARQPNLTVLSVGGRVRSRSLACVDARHTVQAAGNRSVPGHQRPIDRARPDHPRSGRSRRETRHAVDRPLHRTARRPLQDRSSQPPPVRRAEPD